MITALLLAAGRARRFGAPKLVEQLDGKPVIRWSADAVLVPGVDRLLVVVPPEYRDIAAALAGTPASYVVNRDPERGIGASIAAGVGSLDDAEGAVLIALADEPMLDPDVVTQVLEHAKLVGGLGGAIVAPRYRGVPGHPVLFGASVWPELRALDGDRGARSVIERDAARVVPVDVDAPPPGDVDTPADLARLRLRRQNMSRPSPSPRRDS